MKIGILDADVFGPSLPKLINLNVKPESKDGSAMIPVERYGAQCMSMGFFGRRTNTYDLERTNGYKCD